jgi:hypothetical protein
MDRSLKNNGKTGAVNMALKLSLLILLILRIKAKLSGVFKT